MQIAHTQGNDTQRLSAEIIKAGIEAVNPKFSVQVLALPQPDFLESRGQGKLPVFVSGYGEVIHDPHYLVQNFLFSEGWFAHAINMTDDYQAKYDRWILEGSKETDPEKRRTIYETIQLAAQEDAVNIWMSQRTNMIPVQLWMKGVYYNPRYFREAYSWVYALSKEAP
jgi:ABC-type transport system substrate-binding protein